MYDGPTKTREECPSCRGELGKIEGVWTCLNPCGFESRASNPLARLFLYQATVALRQTLRAARQAEQAMPGEFIVDDLKKFMDGEDV